jgi:hypothetical protein
MEKKRLGLCKVGAVGWSSGGEYGGGRDSLVTGWGCWEGEVKAGGESGWEGAERVVGKGSNGL